MFKMNQLRTHQMAKIQHYISVTSDTSEKLHTIILSYLLNMAPDEEAKSVIWFDKYTSESEDDYLQERETKPMNGKSQMMHTFQTFPEGCIFNLHPAHCIV